MSQVTQNWPQPGNPKMQQLPKPHTRQAYPQQPVQSQWYDNSDAGLVSSTMTVLRVEEDNYRVGGSGFNSQQSYANEHAQFMQKFARMRDISDEVEEAQSPNFNEYEIDQLGPDISQSSGSAQKEFEDEQNQFSPITAYPTTQMTTEYNEQELGCDEDRLRQAYSMAAKSQSSQGDHFYSQELQALDGNESQSSRLCDHLHNEALARHVKQQKPL